MTDNSVEKIRRSALLFALLLLLYSFSGIKFDSTKQLLNFPFTIESWVIDFILIAGTVYGLIRFIYYGTILNPSPWKVRQRLKNCFKPTGESYHTPPISRSLNAMSREDELLVEPIKKEILNNIHKYFPPPTMVKYAFQKFEFRKNSKYEIEFTVNPPLSLLSRRQRVYFFLENIDYFSPIWFNTVSLSTYTITRFL
jgi:hypothetical protein